MNKPDCPPSPFVGLVPFREVDAPFFRGRDTERDLIVENLRASRLTLLYGTSGVGKSSVLYAGAAHRLRELARQDVQEYGKPDFAVVTFRTWGDDPIQGLLRSINEAMTEALQVKSLVDVPGSNNLAQTISAWTERYGIELLIILDQFEEYFQYHSNEQGPGTFAEEFPRAVNDPELRAKFLLALRDDALSKLDRFKSQIPYLFDNLLRIRHMSVDAARKAIKEPIDEYNDRCGFKQAGSEYSIETELVEEVIKQVRAGRDTNEGPDGVAGVEAPYLQLVMTRLWEKEREEGSRLLRRQTLEDLKGIKNIVQVYLNNALEQLKPEQKSIAFRMFDYLVTPSGTKIAYFKSDLISQTRFTETQIGGVLEALDKSRILRSVPSIDRPKESRYEVFHDLLALAIINWRKNYEVISELAEVEQKRRVEARKNRRLRLALVLASLLLLLSALTAGYAFMQRSDARDAQRIATGHQTVAQEALKKLTLEKGRADLASAEAIKAKQGELDALTEKQSAKEETKKQTEIAARQTKIIAAQASELVKRLTVQSDLVAFLKSETDPDRRETLLEALSIIRGDKPAQQQESSIIDAGEVPVPAKLWQKGRTLHIRFLGATPVVQQKIERVAQEWTQYANIKFDFNSAPNAEIRIGFDSPGSWSYIGTDALVVSPSEPTMNFGVLTEPNISEEFFRRTVLHEFGHLLGLIHEHQNPNANIPWNKDAVYRTFGGAPWYWSRENVDQMFFRKYSGNYREFDPQSIMMYFPITKDLLVGDTFQPIPELGNVLSERDKEFIKILYPLA